MFRWEFPDKMLRRHDEVSEVYIRRFGAGVAFASLFRFWEEVWLRLSFLDLDLTSFEIPLLSRETRQAHLAMRC
jgi:hypothetical protein